MPEPGHDVAQARSLGNRLRLARLQQRKQQTVVAGLAGITTDYLYQIERGLKLPSLTVLMELARVLVRDDYAGWHQFNSHLAGVVQRP